MSPDLVYRFICVATIVVVILLPINLVYNLKDTKTSDLATRTYLTMITIQVRFPLCYRCPVLLGR